MTNDEALALIERILEQDYLNQTQETIFREAWDGKSYMEISKSTGYDYGYVKDEGAKLWRRMSDTLERKITKANVRSVLKKYAEGMSDREEKLSSFSVDSLNPATREMHSWEESLDIHHFCGRTKEMKILEQWILQENCRLIALVGIGGIGKTTLSAQLLWQSHHTFDYTIWRSLRNAPLLSDLLPELILFLSERQEQLSDDVYGQIGQLMQYLHQHRCLLVLDNLDAILLGKTKAGVFLEDYKDYQYLIERIADESHQSCLLLTSREKPMGFSQREGKCFPVRLLQLGGLAQSESQQIIYDKGLSLDEDDYAQLVQYYCGNPLALKIATAAIKDIFHSDIGEFFGYSTLVFGELWDVFQQQYDRLSVLEKVVMYWWVVNHEWLRLPELRKDVVPVVSRRALLEAVDSLKARSLIDSGTGEMTQQPLIMKFMAERLSEGVDTDLDQQNFFD